MNLPNPIKTTRTRMLRAICAGVLALAAPLGAMSVAAQPASAATPERCFQYSGSWDAKAAGMTVFNASETLRWCGQNGRITKFSVLRCKTESRHRLVTESRAAVCVPVGGLGGRTLDVDGSFWARSNRIPKVGSLNFEGHTHVTLHPDGGITGSVVMPK